MHSPFWFILYIKCNKILFRRELAYIQHLMRNFLGFKVTQFDRIRVNSKCLARFIFDLNLQVMQLILRYIHYFYLYSEDFSIRTIIKKILNTNVDIRWFMSDCTLGEEQFFIGRFRIVLFIKIELRVLFLINNIWLISCNSSKMDFLVQSSGKSWW
jgi:hypothetical protein